MNRKILIAIGIIFAIIAIVVILRSPEDSWICQNGQWVKHGNPSSPMPTSGCGTSQSTQEPDIIVTSPQSNQIITSPLSIEGKAKGSWYFEAVAPVRLLDDKGNVLASGQIQTQGDWMTSDYVPFKAELTFSYNATTSGTLLFHNDNPSGLPENDKEFNVSVQLVPIQTLNVNAYFNNNNLDPQISCNKVFPVQRQIAKTQTVAMAAVSELLKGPSDAEKSQGYYTNINPGVKIQKMTIENGVAKADFDETLETAVGGSCRVSAIRVQITETLKQFPTVQSVIISINGRTEDILQP
ncbi:MAG: hypothetical protein AUJ32_00905 [Parcubacteria group bacterium CG1_02_40_82]|uniref:GerMN domain-containing protein n=4 Tax=Candidatus Portnoyibacteriota TaxID=1817913 RepID=A0A2M7IIV2_9BACT|nr:MAG: hypothetical protein AUJ32_00905 [Parcubacteria group bacterium CG1_02_40_82]PIQ75127.1 MAG: hypothetical protein COV84_02940 [Candidatus Portnoybacteria bacterium CG11_big_fil_rev_8_21_14_0_20_40_15]PIS31562.1 MAG: hypothetical protein COT41_01415 [Candidatus Portnoybacteria bacterium CG08_land_8_20_14_0_20_40_83]PIW76399.1 MAG: hypothetical protein CO001_01575 [Candidatus Portnoybacteria bacterium CG_4_8_14_3_um_filter_40_10]PIY74913.1 MAG: hypothetical protein COY85_01865 [Candidatus